MCDGSTILLLDLTALSSNSCCDWRLVGSKEITTARPDFDVVDLGERVAPREYEPEHFVQDCD
jgi:hypothetical protein